MNQILDGTYEVTITLRTAFTIRAGSKEEAQACFERMIDNEREFIQIEILGSDVDWIVLKEDIAVEVKER